MENINLLDFLSPGIISKTVEAIPLYSILGIYDSIIYLRDFLNDSVKRNKIKDKYRIHCLGDCDSITLSNNKNSENVNTDIFSDYDLINVYVRNGVISLKTSSDKLLGIKNNTLNIDFVENPYKINLDNTSIIIIDKYGLINVAGFSIDYSLGDGDQTPHLIQNMINIPVLDEHENPVLFTDVSTYQENNETLSSYFISTDGQVYRTGVIDNINIFDGPFLFPILDNNGNPEFIVKTLSNKKTSIYLTENGEVYYTGTINIESYNLPNNIINRRTHDPVKIQILDDNGNVEIIKDFAINDKSVMYLTSNNDLYHIEYRKMVEVLTQGGNGYKFSKNTKTLMNVFDDYGNIQNIVKIVMKEKFILYLTDNGDVYYSGKIDIFKNRQQLFSKIPIKFSLINDIGIVTDIDANNNSIMFIT